MILLIFFNKNKTCCNWVSKHDCVLKWYVVKYIDQLEKRKIRILETTYA